MGIISDPSETEEIAISVKDSGGVYFVPAFVSLAAPYWDPYARGAILGITEGVTREHIVRAALEAIAYRTREVIECMEADSSLKIESLRVDGGPTANRFLMQFQADILGVPVFVPDVSEMTALGVAYLAGMAVDFWEGLDEIQSLKRSMRIYRPTLEPASREVMFSGWKRAVQRAAAWEEM